MRFRRRHVTGLVVGLFAVGAVVMWWSPTIALLGPGSTRIEAWCGRQLVAIVADHLNPRLVLGELDYEFPRTVHVRGVRLEAGGVAIVEATSARIEFAEIPLPGRPLVIKVVDLQEPVVRLEHLDDGTLVGFGDFVKDTGGRELPDGGSSRLSDVLAVTRIDVRDGMLEYHRPGQPPMRLHPLTFDLQREAETTDAEGGWYAFDATLAFLDVAEISGRIRLNVDTAVLDLPELQLHSVIDPDHYEVFPPQVQASLREHLVQGQFSARVRGTVPLRDAALSLLNFRARVTSATVSFGDYVLPVQVLSATGRMSGGVLDIESATIDALGGQARLWARQWIDDPARPFELRGQGTGLRLEEAMRPESPEASKLAGRLDFHVEARGQTGNLPASLDGQGEITLTEGRLVNGKLARALMTVLSLVPTGGGQDRGRAAVALAGDRVSLRDVQIIVGGMGVKGEGEVFYDGRLNLRLNAGPLERLQEALGDLGKVFGAVTDRLNKYHVTGTLGAPEVKVRPLGIGVGKPEPPE